MFPGGFRAKLNSRSHRRASVFATTVLALQPSLLALRRPRSQLSCNSMGTATRSFRTSRSVGSIHDADYIRTAPVEHRGKGMVVWLRKKDVGDVPLLLS